MKWDIPEDLGGYDESIQAKDLSFTRSKGGEKHARKLVKCEKFLEVEESIWTLLIQAVDELFIEPLKEDYIGYGRRMPYEVIEHLQTIISKMATKEKVQLKDKVFIKWEQPQVFLAY